MAPSANTRNTAVAATCIVALSGLTACQTTQETAARKAVDSARKLDVKPVVVTKSNPDVSVGKPSILAGPNGSAVAVSLQNTGTKPVNDLPISVGVVLKGKPILLNEKASGSYFKNHAPALAPGAVTTYVVTTKKDLKKAKAPFVRVGLPAAKPPTVATSVPNLEATPVGFTDGPDGPSLKVSVHNTTGDPQYGLTVYAWAIDGNRYFAAGRSGATDLSTGDTDTVTIPLVGRANEKDVQIAAPATIFD